MPTLSMVADAFRAAGMGHLSRCTAVASAWRSLGAEVECFGLGADAPRVHDGVEWIPRSERETSPGPGDVQLIDSYVLPPDAFSAAAARGPLVLMHDHGEPPPDAALVVTASPPPQSRANVLAGPRYACLRRAYWSPRERLVRDRVACVFLSLGAAAKRERLDALTRIIEAAIEGVEVRMAAGISAPEGLHDELAAADLVVCAGGQTMLEAAATGAPAVVLVEAENQAHQVAGLERLGAVRITDDAGLGHRVAELAASSADRRALSEAARSAVDGQGALRVASAIMEIAPR